MIAIIKMFYVKLFFSPHFDLQKLADPDSFIYMTLCEYKQQSINCLSFKHIKIVKIKQWDFYGILNLKVFI